MSFCKITVLLFNFSYSFSQCMDIFEKEFDGVLIGENVADTNRYYGGRSIPITNVVFPNGAIDPWHAMGVTKDISPTATAIYMKGMTKRRHINRVFSGIPFFLHYKHILDFHKKNHTLREKMPD